MIEMLTDYNIFKSVENGINSAFIAEGPGGFVEATYYLRNRAASKVEKSTETPEEEPSACSIEAMQNGEICESCQ